MKLGRRRMLLGLGGVTVSLPFLESLSHAGPAYAQDDRAGFVVWVRSGNGVAQRWSSEPEQFWPREPGALSRAVLADQNGDRATSELADFADRLNILKGIHRPFGTPSCGHSESIVQCLTAANFDPGSSNSALPRGRSADWLVAEQLNPAGTEPLTLMAGPASGFINEAISWRGSRDRAPADRSPQNVYMRLMGLSAVPPEIQRRIAERRLSVNDLVRDQMQALLARPQLGSRDRRRLTQHFEAIRDLELRTMCALDPEEEAAILAIDNPLANDVRPDVVRRHMDLIAFAFSCGYTHAATLQIGEGNDQTQYEIGGSRLPRFHWVSHRIYSDGSEGEPIPDAVTLHHQIDRLHMQLFRHLLERLDAYDSPYGGTLLDDTAAVWLNDLAAGPPHNGDNVPWIIGGSCGGRLSTGRFHDFGNVRINRVLNTLLTAVGCTKDDGSPIDNFGDSSLEGGVLDELLTG